LVAVSLAEVAALRSRVCYSTCEMAKLAAGSQLGPYQVVALVGAGGMGEVYKARDTRLNRFVAIKVLLGEIASQPDAKQRFEHEAQTIASLNHPGICVLHDVGNQEGIDFLVMEYLEGETLAERLSRGALPIREALDYAVQICDALDKAHRQGVTHRDLKPGNIMLTKSGTKLLDFGLARLRPNNKESAAASAASRLTAANDLTIHGVIRGTLQYMAPEQLLGRDADARTDIFAFGAVLFEMLTGKKIFDGNTHTELIAAILERDPVPVSHVQPAVTRSLDRLTRRCIAKDPNERWQTVIDLMNELQWVLEDMRSGVASDRIGRRSFNYWKPAALALFVLAIGFLLAALYPSPKEYERNLVRYSVNLPDKINFDSVVNNTVARTVGFTVSPDGRHFAFSGRDATGKVRLWTLAVDSISPKIIPDTEGASVPFWSPDSRFIAFYAQGKLKRVEINGGPVQTICNAGSVTLGGAWNSQGTIVFALEGGSPLYRVSSSGGEPLPITKLENQSSHRWPSFLPDDRHFVYFASGDVPANSGIFLGDVQCTQKRLLAADSGAVYAPPGFLVFVRQGTLLAQQFDSKRLETIGDPKPLAENVAVAEIAAGGLGGFSVSHNGVLTYRTGSPLTENVNLIWVDRSGKDLEEVGKPAPYRGIELSPDGKRLAVHVHEDSGGDIWVFEPSRATPVRLTFEASQHNMSPIWSPDGKQIVFGSQRAGMWGLYKKASNGSGDEEQLFVSQFPMTPVSWSEDGVLFWRSDPRTSFDLWFIPVKGEKALPFLQTVFNESHGQVSPDGKWIAYRSNESGREEIYVRPFPTGSGRWQVSTNGGTYPRWNAKGTELFYMSAASLGKLMVVEVKTAGSEFGYGVAKDLFDSRYVNYPHGSTTYHTYAVSLDGQRFLIPRPEAPTADPSGNSATVILNWTALLH
jgi:serine/threonine protein kinase